MLWFLKLLAFIFFDIKQGWAVCVFEVHPTTYEGKLLSNCSTLQHKLTSLKWSIIRRVKCWLTMPKRGGGHLTSGHGTYLWSRVKLNRNLLVIKIGEKYFCLEKVESNTNQLPKDCDSLNEWLSEKLNKPFLLWWAFTLSQHYMVFLLWS